MGRGVTCTAHGSARTRPFASFASSVRTLSIATRSLARCNIVGLTALSLAVTLAKRLASSSVVSSSHSILSAADLHRLMAETEASERRAGACAAVESDDDARACAAESGTCAGVWLRAISSPSLAVCSLWAWDPETRGGEKTKKERATKGG